MLMFQFNSCEKEEKGHIWPDTDDNTNRAEPNTNHQGLHWIIQAAEETHSSLCQDLDSSMFARVHEGATLKSLQIKSSLISLQQIYNVSMQTKINFISTRY